MITYKRGNLLDVTEGVIIHGCNAQGVMGSGVALAVKNKYPKAYEQYMRVHAKQGLRLAGISLSHVDKDLTVCNLVTQEFYGREGKRYTSYGAVHLGFEKLHKYYALERTFHFPKIGAGLGGGDWLEIARFIEYACPGRHLVCWEL